MKKTLFESSIDEFTDFVSRATLDLSKNNKEYAKEMENNRILLNKYKKVRDILESDNPKSLNEEECNALIKVLENMTDMKYFEFEEIFFKGAAEAFYMCQRMKVVRFRKEKKFQKLLKNLIYGNGNE